MSFSHSCQHIRGAEASGALCPEVQALLSCAQTIRERELLEKEEEESYERQQQRLIARKVRAQSISYPKP